MIEATKTRKERGYFSETGVDSCGYSEFVHLVVCDGVVDMVCVPGAVVVVVVQGNVVVLVVGKDQSILEGLTGGGSSDKKGIRGDF